MNHLFIVRHGRTFAPGETARRIGARTDLPLVAEGASEATALGRFFTSQGISFAAALAGPLQRARTTAEIILAHQCDPVPLEICDWLQEIDHGIDENMPESHVTERLGVDAIAAWDDHGICPPGWAADAPRRLDAWSRLFADHEKGAVLAVTSSGAARFALLALSMPTGDGSLKLGTGCYAEMTLSRGRWTLKHWNHRP